jgi:hypothetical protein
MKSLSERKFVWMKPEELEHTPMSEDAPIQVVVRFCWGFVDV